MGCISREQVEENYNTVCQISFEEMHLAKDINLLLERSRLGAVLT